jgi:hypothetical protein
LYFTFLYFCSPHTRSPCLALSLTLRFLEVH